MSLRETLSNLLRIWSKIWQRYPVETGILFLLLLAWWHDYFGMPTPVWVCLAPLAAATALALNFLTRTGRLRAAYYVSWIPWVAAGIFVPSSWLNEWVATSQYVISVTILAPLALLLARRSKDNRRFADDCSAYVEVWLAVLLCAAAINGIWSAIWLSLGYIFGIMDYIRRIYDDGFAVINTLLTGTLLLTMLDMRFAGRVRRTAATSRLTDGIVNYLLTPALFVYTAILYVYLAKIIVTWSLPKGGVAYMVFGYTMTAFVVRALRENAGRRMFDRFFERLSIIVLPTLALFWTGVAHRVIEYGYTDWRVYLIICGAVMTFCTLAFLSRRTGRYYYVAAAAALLFLVTAYVPRFSAERIGLRSQTERAERLAARTGLLLDDGRIDLTHRTEIDTLLLDDYYELGQSLHYLYMKNDTLTLRNRFGIANYYNDYYAIFPEKYDARIRWGSEYDIDTVEEVVTHGYTYLSTPHDMQVAIDGFSKSYRNFRNDYDCDSVRIVLPGRKITFSKDDMMRTQLQKAGLDSLEHLSTPALEQAADRLLVYDTGDARIVFSALYFEYPEGREPKITTVNIDEVFIR